MGHADMARVPHVVADTGAFLSAAPLQDIADALYTVPEVLAEIRDRPARRRLAALPCELRVRRPRPELLRLGECRAGPGSRPAWGTASFPSAPRPGPAPPGSRSPARPGPTVPLFPARSNRILQEDRGLPEPVGRRPAGARPHMPAPGRDRRPRLPPLGAAGQGAAQLHPAAPRGPPAPRRLPPARQGKARREGEGVRPLGAPGEGSPCCAPSTSPRGRARASPAPAAARPRRTATSSDPSCTGGRPCPASRRSCGSCWPSPVAPSPWRNTRRNTRALQMGPAPAKRRMRRAMTKAG
uniref:Ribonuclease PIN domain-containing protein n=1 Tax=Corvus moneduloides TaxID=1196302 RepID=A0A8U7MH40_CORMO